MDRDIGKGPFTVEKQLAHLNPGMDVGGEEPASLKLVEIVDAAGNSFAYVDPADCAGEDEPAAKSRATRIAEALNRDDRQKAALTVARQIIQNERDSMVECATMPPHDDLATLNDLTAKAVAAYDQALAHIDEALR